MIEIIKSILKANALGRVIYPFLNKIYRLYSVPARRRNLQKHGYNVLEELLKIASEEGIQVVPIFGTMLGFVRDKGFIAHDDDIDIAILPGLSPKEVARVFIEKYGYKFRHGLAYHGECTEFTLQHKSGLTIDFFFMFDTGEYLQTAGYYWYPEQNYTDTRQNNVIWIKHDYFDEFTNIHIHGVEINLPNNYESWLYSSYGPDWRTPDPSFSDENGMPGYMPAEDYGYAHNYEELITNKIPQ